jgi:hypothetical protein
MATETTKATGAAGPGVAGSPVPPHIIAEIHGIYSAWVPADPGAVGDLVPAGLTAAEDRVVSLFQGAQDLATTSWGGRVSITHAEVELSGADTLDGRLRGRWWVLYLNSDPFYLAGAHMLGIPGAREGRTEVALDGEVLTATTFDGETAIIRTTAHVGTRPAGPFGVQARYLIPGDGFPSILVPVAAPAHAVEVRSIEFLEPGHPSYVLRPAEPLRIAWSLYSPRLSYAFSGPTVVG